MRHLPPQNPAVPRGRSTTAFTSGLGPSGCSIFKKVACAAAVAACAATCAAGGACAACFAGLGMSSCIDCL